MPDHAETIRDLLAKGEAYRDARQAYRNEIDGVRRIKLLHASDAAMVSYEVAALVALPAIKAMLEEVEELRNEVAMHRNLQAFRDGRSKPVEQIIADLKDKVSDSLKRKD